ncbi:MAG: hypothetical protein HKL92_05225 [Candidatus Eremiobacteraeota bacterium]|nr:hypothetical protein [Candidatus Eremiobacteraeota bacterium]NNM92725.1 hypothetical protein [Candidatus Eremiobacteraeota bacterium]
MLLAAAAFAGCAAAPQAQAQRLTESMTRAILSDNPGSVAHGLSGVGKISRAEVGLLSDKLNALGKYQGLKLLAYNATKNEFAYRANFTKGETRIVVRLDRQDRLSAYRVF